MNSAPFTPPALQGEKLFPRAWAYWADDLLPSYVKKAFSPDPRWADKPFSPKDISFFGKGVEELSDRFTSDRHLHREKGGTLEPYLLHPRFQSSYMLYFLPMHAAKFLFLIEKHEAQLKRVIFEGPDAPKEPYKVVDLGSGPGTASFGLLFWIMRQIEKDPELSIRPIEFELIDGNANILNHGKKLFEDLLSRFGALREKIKISTHALRRTEPLLRPLFPKIDLLLCGNVVNELSNSTSEEAWGPLLNSIGSGNALFVEPASRSGGQGLSHLRDYALEDLKGLSVLGPCLHAGRCPLGQGRDWCHFSAAVRVKGTVFQAFSRMLGSEREWLKFSYLWLVGEGGMPAVPKKAKKAKTAFENKLVLSDPFKDFRENVVLVCEPEAPGKVPVGSYKIFRGDLITG